MKIILLSLCCVAVFCLNASAAVVKPGEKIYYNVSQLGLKVAEATLTFVGEQDYKEQKTILVLFHAKGFNFFDDEKIYLDPDTYKPVIVLRDLNIFGNKEKIEEQYSEGHVKVLKEGKGEQTIDKAGVSDNIYAFIYRYRQSGSFKIGDRLDLHLPTKDISIKLVKQLSLVTAGKKYSTFYMESDPAKYKLWFDSSEGKLPLRISGAIGVSNTTMVMTKYEN